jgi:type II secretory pathway component GspD/PulD (secretin)
MSVAAGILLAPAGLRAQTETPTGAGGTTDQVYGRPSRVHNAFRLGTECYRKSDYERAASYFQEAQAGQDTLSVEDRQSLAQWLDLNNSALRARRDGAKQLRDAEAALKKGRTQEAQALLKAVTQNQAFLAATDKLRLQQLNEQLTPNRSGTMQVSGTDNGGALARSRLKQARLFMSKGNYDAAWALAQEAERLNVVYAPGEDSPQRVYADISQAKAAAAKPKDAKGLLAAARAALQRGELDKAEEYAHDAEKASSMLSMAKWWGDSPSKVLRDVKEQRAKLAARQPVTPAPTPNRTATVQSFKPNAGQTDTAASSADSTEVARRLVKDARQAMQLGNTAQAKQLAERARSLKPDLKWWEDTPEKLLSDIRQVEGSKDVAKAKDGPALDNHPMDPRALLKQARERYTAGKLEEAEKLAQQANSVKLVRWGLFEDTPDKLLVDIRKARFKHDQEESVRVLAEARKQLETGNLKEADRLAHRAQKLHGPYSLLDLGDRPSKLLAEIEVAKSKQQSTPVPPPPTAVAQNTTSVPKPTPSGVTTAKAVPPATNVAAAQPALPGVPAPVWPGTTERKNDTSLKVTSSPPATFLKPVPPAVDTRKARAQGLLAEARQLQKQDRLVEAYTKAKEAQKVGANFGPDEDRPELALLAVSALCQKRIEMLVQQASDHAAFAQIDPSRMQRAQADLSQARRLAVTFGFDTVVIDNKLSALQQPANKSNDSSAVASGHVSQAHHQEVVSTGGSTELQQGQNLLKQARLELRAGQTASARRLAEMAFEPQYGVQNEAAQVLRSIDAEEYNQRVLTDNRSFEAGLAAFGRHEYVQAATIFRAIDPHHLNADKQARLKEIMQVPEMQPGTVTAAGFQTPDRSGQPAPGRATATDLVAPKPPSVENDFAKQVLAMQEVKFQKLRKDGLDAQSQAMKLFQAGETDQALEVLQDYNASVASSGLDAERVAQLRRPIDTRLAQLKTLKHQRDFEKLQANQHESAHKAVAQKALMEQEKDQQVKQLMKQSNECFKAGKYREAEMYATRAKDLDPDNPVPGAAIYTSRIMANQVKYDRIKKDKEDFVVNSLDDAENPGPAVSSSSPLLFDEKISTGNRNRKSIPLLTLERQKTDREREIYRRLEGPVPSMDFKDMPLRQILDDLQGWTGVNVVPDKAALESAGINIDQPMTMKLEGIALKSALNVLLQQAHLTYVIKDEVLQITTEENARGKLETRIHPVLDLVIPVDNAPGIQTPSALKPSGDGGLKVPGVTPWEGRNSMTGGKDVSMSQFQNGAPVTGAGIFGTTQVTKENPRGTTEDVLIKLITNTIAPQSWTTVGGQGTIDFFPLGMALVINQTPDIQEQVAELLSALRRLQDQEVAVEIRFITIAEAFYERIGVDFNINIRNNNTKYEPQLVSQQFKPFGFINNFSPSHFVTGLTPAGTFTQDLGIPIRNSSFQMAVPPFGEYPNTPGANGGLSLGLAFLSDIEVYLFMEAAQGDQRTNVMQAPKLTLFNGQTSTLNVLDTQFFVTSVTVAQLGGQVVFVPINTPIPTGGVSLSLNAVISADRRFVRLSIAPTLTNLASANVPLFPITTFITPIFEGGAVGQPIPFTQFLQQPNINTITVNTTVNVPDGGTVLMGGLKRLSEGRNEFGPPVLSKIPYLNRLFKNVGYGREAESLLMMVTPRIIINEEEEIRQVPGIAAAAPGQ